MIERKNYVKKASKALILILLLLFFNIGAKYPVLSSTAFSNRIGMVEKTNESLENYPILVRQRLHNRLVLEVKNYINLIAPTSEINADTLVTLCQKYNMDITIVIAQGVLESHLGTKGLAVETHSVFNVGSYDNGVIHYKYKDPNASIEPFLKLIREDYLGEKKKMNDLVRDGGYKNLNGHRYATSTLYEQRLRTTIVHVEMNSSISMYQGVMDLSNEDILAFFGPETEELSTQKLLANNTLNDTIKREF